MRRASPSQLRNRKLITWYEDPRVVELYQTRTVLRRAEEYLVDTYFPQTCQVLDIGCGTGRTTMALESKGFRVTAIDNAEPMIAAARKRYPDLQWLHMDATNLTFEDAAFDVSFFSFNGIDGIHPVSLRLNCLKEMIRVTKPGGLIVYSSHNLLARIFKRFSTGRSLLSSARSLWWELKDQFDNKKFLSSYIKHPTDEGKIVVYMSTINNNLRQFRSVCGRATLLEVVGLVPGEGSKQTNFVSETVYYVWRKH